LIPLPFTWPALLPFWTAFVWAFVAEGPIARRDGLGGGTAVDQHSKRLILVAGTLATLSALFVATVLRQFSVATGRRVMYAAGIVCLVAGGQLRRHCFRMLGDSFTYDVRVRAGQAVVERGAYRYVRHPSYAAGLLLFGGVGLALTNWLSLAVALLLPALAYAYRISVEERVLVETLGPAYARYMKRTKRLVPFVI
jgi:protein-S-isoprenylcysteine O-methyltransferase Ste14